MIEYVCGFLISTQYDRILMVEKMKPDWQRGKYNGVGGKVEPTDKDHFAAMRREFKEETGLVGYENWSYLGHIADTMGTYMVHFYTQHVRDLPKYPLASYDFDPFISEGRLWKNDIGENLEYLIYSNLLTGQYKDCTLLNLNWIIPFIHYSGDYTFSVVINED